MKKFKTNIKCTGCIETVTPALDRVAGPHEWSVDLNDRTLTVSTEIPDEEIVKALEQVGYNAETLKS